mgnify:CR=1 FL=1
MKNITLYFLTLILLTFGQSVYASQKLVLGVYQYQEKSSVQLQYQEFANYLADSLPNNDVELKVFSQEELLSALQQKQVQLLLVHPSL